MEAATLQIRRPPIASEAEIRAYLVPKIKAGKPPTYAAMRADLGGGGYSRLVRIRNSIEAEFAGEAPETEHADELIAGAELVATLEALFDRQWKALEGWERRWTARLEPAPSKSKAAADSRSAQADRLEAVERRIMALLDKLQVLARAPTPPPACQPTPRVLEDVPPAWARQAAAAATAALDGRLQSMEETIRDASTGGKAAFDLAAEIAREVASDASLQMQMARSSLTKALREEFVSPDRLAIFEEVRQKLASLCGHVDDGFSKAAAVADRRAVAIRDVIIAMTEIEVAQVEMFEMGVVNLDRIANERRKSRSRSMRR